MKTTTWALQDAKNRLSEVVEKAMHEGPQTITRRGRETAIILSTQDFRNLMATDGTLIDFFRASPLRKVSLDLERAKDYGREVKL